MSEHTCPVMTSLLLPTVTVALALALETTQDCDDVIRAAALRKEALLGEAKHGRFDAETPAEVAQDVDQDALCYRPEEHGVVPEDSPLPWHCGIVGHHAVAQDVEPGVAQPGGRWISGPCT